MLNARLLLILIIATYFNAVLHELPNVTAQQWVYAQPPVLDYHVSGIPVLVLAFWPLLTVIPVAAYYSIMQKPLALSGRRPSKGKS